MGRRKFLLGTAAVVTAGLAGCSALGGSERVDESFEPSNADNLAIAVGQLNKAALAVEGVGEQADSGDDQRIEFDASEPRERVSTAREALSKAADGGAEEATVDAVRSYADGVGETVESVAEVATASNRLATVRDSLDDDVDDGDVDTDSAKADLAEATTASQASRNAHEAAETALDGADRERLEAVDAEYDAVRSGLEDLRGYVIGVDGLAVGYEDYVGGIDALQTAQDRVDTDEFDTARASFRDAQTRFDDAAAVFTDSVDGAASDLESDLTEGDERSRALDRLAAGYVSLLDSRDHVKTAESAIESDDDDTARADLQAGRDDATAAADQFDRGAAIRESEFDDEFGMAKDRAAAMESLSGGYTSVLDAGDHLERAEAAFTSGATQRSRRALSAASADATTAEQTFADGEELAPEKFGEELSTGRSRAAALNALASGYEHLLDARTALEDGEGEFTDGRYGSAERSFGDAESAAGDAETTFSDGQSDDEGDFFESEFDRAFRRASVLGSLSEGYGLIASGRQQTRAGRRELEAQNYASAADDFREAGSTFESAESAFEDADADASDEFGPRVDRALCRVGHLRDATAHFVAAAEAGERGDGETFSSELSAADADLDRVDRC